MPNSQGAGPLRSPPWRKKPGSLAALGAQDARPALGRASLLARAHALRAGIASPEGPAGICPALDTRGSTAALAGGGEGSWHPGSRGALRADVAKHRIIPPESHSTPCCVRGKPCVGTRVASPPAAWGQGGDPRGRPTASGFEAGARRGRGPRTPSPHGAEHSSVRAAGSLWRPEAAAKGRAGHAGAAPARRPPTPAG